MMDPSRPFQPFNPPTNIRSPVLNAAPAVPSLDELYALEKELLALHTGAKSRAERAQASLSGLENVYKKAKEKKKVIKKANSIVETKLVINTGKIKREYSGTPDGDDAVSVASSSRPLMNGNRKPPNPSAAKAAAIKAASLPQPHPVPPPKISKAKAKRKRVEESDEDMESINSDLMPPPSQRPRPSPHPHPSHPSSSASASHHHHPPTASKTKPSHAPPPIPTPTTAQPKSALLPPPVPLTSSIAVDFSVPPRPTLPVKPVGTASGGFTYTTMPTDPKDVLEDFSDRKAPSNQTPVHTFWKEVESWMRPVGEEDVAWLEFDAEDLEPFLIPALGKHYTEVWEEEDRQAALRAAEVAQSWPRGYSLDRTFSVPLEDPPPSATASQAPQPPPTPTTATTNTAAFSNPMANWDPKTLQETDLPKEEKGLGPVTERIMSALLLDERLSSTKDEAERGIASGWTGKAANIPGGVSGVGDLEARIRGELRALGLLSDEEPTFSPPWDDDITSTLRRCQALLQDQRRVNLARKNRLLSIARDRLAYQDYLSTLEGLEKSITAGYTKMLKRNQPHSSSHQKKKKDKDKDKDKEEEGEKKGAASVILDPPEALMEKVRLRARWVGAFGKAMDEWEEREPGRLRGLPKKSIYEGIEEGSASGQGELEDGLDALVVA